MPNRGADGLYDGTRTRLADLGCGELVTDCRMAPLQAHVASGPEMLTVASILDYAALSSVTTTAKKPILKQSFLHQHDL